jgi:hypothetical protein
MLKNLTLKALLTVAISLYATIASANTYYLNQSNTLADGVNYAQVDVLESAGNLNFTVQALEPTNWKFSNFYFNLIGSVGTVSLTGLPSGWSADTNQNVSSFGVFSDGAKGTGNSLQNLFTFTVDSTVALSLANLGANLDGWIFAGHVQCQDKKDSPCSAVEDETSHFIAGPGTSEVPLPAAAWLFGSALLGFVGFGKRNRV